MAHTGDFLYFFNNLQKLACLWPSLTVSGFNVSTATMLARFNSRVQLSALDDMTDCEALLHPGQLYPHLPCEQLRIIRHKRRQRKVGEFGNQVTLAFRSGNQHSIKVFTSGSLHMTGCKTIEEFQRIAAVVEALLFATCAIQERWTLDEPRVQMLNFNYKLNCTLRLSRLADVVLETFGVYATHETESHPALMIRLLLPGGRKDSLAMVFNSGNVLISSPDGLAGVNAMFRLVCQLVHDRYEDVRGTRPLDAGHKKRKWDLVVDGYPAGQALPCCPPQAAQAVHSGAVVT